MFSDKRRLLALMVSLCAPFASAASHSIVYDHGTNSLTCDKVVQASPCVIQAAEGDLLQISVINSAPSLLTATLTKVDLHADELKSIQDKLFPPTPATPSTITKSGGAQRVTGVAAAYAQAVDAVEEINEAIAGTDAATGGMIHFQLAKERLAGAVEGLVIAAGTPDLVPKKIKDAGLAADMTDAELAAWWKNVLALNKVSNLLQPMLAKVMSVTDDADITVTFALKTPPNPLIEAVPAPFMIAVRLSKGWRITSSTGFAASRLVDDVYTTKTVVDTPATATTPEVSHREAVREDRDAATPEASFFVHTRYLGERSSLTNWLPRDITFGLGLATGTSGRLYTGLGYPLGQRGSVIFGVAAGKVKRLSKNINPKNLGTADPQASRRDVFQFAPFVALSWRFNP